MRLLRFLPPALRSPMKVMRKRAKKVFKKCAACHQVGEKAKKKVGPVLNNIFGMTAGTQEDFKYSKAMIAKGEEGLVWTDETMAEYLKKPKEVCSEN